MNNVRIKIWDFFQLSAFKDFLYQTYLGLLYEFPETMYTTVFTFLQESSDNGEPKKKKVMFNVVETAATENEEDKPKKKVTRVPRESTREIIDADVECEKWNEQCKQQ